MLNTQTIGSNFIPLDSFLCNFVDPAIAGTNRFDYKSGNVNKYAWVEKGGSFLNSEILSTLLFDQLELFDQIQQKRRFIYNMYLQELNEFTKSIGLSGSFLEVDEEHAAHVFFLEFNNLEQRNLFISAMKSFETTAFHYQALHNSEGGKIWKK